MEGASTAGQPAAISPTELAHQRLQQLGATPLTTLSQAQELVAELLAQQQALVLENQQLHAAQQELAASEARLQAAEAVAGMGSYELDLASELLHLSAGLYRLLGEVPGSFRPSLDWLDGRSNPEDAQTIRRLLDQAIRDKQPYRYSRRMRRADGEWRVFESHGRVVCDQEGAAIRLEGVVEDKTDPPHATDALHVATQRLRATIDSSLDMVQVFEAVRDEQGALVDFTWVLNNSAAERYYGDVVGRRLCQLNPGVVEAGIFDAFKQVLETGVPDQREHHYVHEQFDGWFYQSTVRLGDGVTTTTHDISARKRLEQELREAKELLQAVLDSSRYVVQAFKAVRDEQRKIVDFTWVLTNETWLNQYGGVMTGKSVLQENPGVVETGLFALFVQVTETGVPVDHEQYYAHEQFAGWFHQTLIKLGDGFVMNTLDITERKKAEQQLRQSQHLLQTVFDVSLNPIAYHKAVRDAGGRIIDFEFQLENRKARQYAAAERTGQRFSEAYPGIRETVVFRLYCAVVETGQPLDTEVPLRLQGTDRWFHLMAVKLDDGLVATAVDVTERKQAQEELLRLQEELAQQATNNYQALLEATTQGFCRLQLLFDETEQHAVDFRYLELNPAFVAHAGLPADALGKSVRELVPNSEPLWLATYGRVALTGQAEHIEYPVAQLGRWYDAHAFRIGPPAARQVGVLFSDVTARKRREANLAFMASLMSDFAPLSTVEEVTELAGQRITNYLQLSHCFFVAVDPAAGECTVLQHTRPAGLPAMTGTYRLDDFHTPAENQLLAAGQPMIVGDVNDGHRTAAQVAAYQALDIRTLVNTPHVAEGRWVFDLGVGRPQPGTWAPDEIDLLQDVAGRVWLRLERAAAEAALRASEEKYRTLFNSMDDGVATLELLFDEKARAVDYILVELNAALTKQTGLSSDIIGKRVSEIFPDLEAYWFEAFERVVKTGVPERHEYYVAALDSWFAISTTRVADATNRKVVCIYNNITERKRRELNAALLDEIGKDLATLSAPDEIMQLVGRRLGEFLKLSGCYFVDVDEAKNEIAVHHGWASGQVPSLLQTFKLKEYLTENFVRTMRAGTVFVLRDTAQDERAEAQRYARLQVGSFVTVPFFRQGRYIGHIAVTTEQAHDWQPQEIQLLQEISSRIFPRIERARAEEALAASEQRLQTVFDALPVGIGLTAADGRLTMANHQMQRYLPTGIMPSRDETQLPRWYAEGPDGHPLPPTEFPGARAQRGERIVPGLEMLHTPAEGPPVWTQVFAVPLQYRHNQVVGHVTVILDITARKQAEQQLRAVAEAEAFRLQLADALGPLADAVAIQEAVTRLARQHFGADRCYYCEIEGGQVIIRRDAAAEGLPSVAGTYPLANFAVIEAGRPLVVRDVRENLAMAESLRQLCMQLQVISYLDVPVIKNGQPVGVLCLVQSTPREWTAAETALAAEVAERTWTAVVRARAEEALRASEDQFRAVANLGPDLLWRSSPASDTTWYNQRWYEYTGQTPAEAVGYGWTDVVHPDDRAESARRYHAAVASGEPLRQEYRIRSAQGEYRWFQVRALPFHNAQGDVTAWFGAATDIHARKQAELALAASEQRLRALITNLPGAAAFVVGPDLRYQLAGGEALYAAGFAPADLLGRTLAEVMPPELVPRYEAHYRQALGGQGFSVEHTAHGRTFISRGVPLLGLASQPEAVLVVSYDITERKQAEEALRASEAQLAEFNTRLEQRVARRTQQLQESRDLLRSVFDTSLVSMSVLYAERDKAGQVLDFRLGLVNKELERETGRTDLVGKLYGQEYPGIRQVGIFDLMLKALATGEPQGMEYFYDHEGFSRWYTCQFVRLGDGLVATNLDITERRIAEQERLKNLRLLEQAEAVAGLGSWDYNLATGTMHWSDGMYYLFGLPLGTPAEPSRYLAVVLDEDRPRAEGLVRQLTAGQGFEETIRLRVHEQVKTVRMKAIVVSSEADQPARVLGVDLDISQLQHLESENLRLRLRQQQVLFEAVQAAEEAERRRMSESLHNGIGQLLYATKLQLDSFPATPESAPHQQAARLLGEAIRQTRALSHELTPATLEEFGLAKTLQSICATLNTPRLHWHCHLVLEQEASLPLPLQLAVYRLAQELVQNVLKHAQATEATLEVEVLPGWVVLRVEDNGRGFDPTHTSDGLGLRSLRGRVALLGGQVYLTTAPQKGTQLQIHIPLSPMPSS